MTRRTGKPDRNTDLAEAKLRSFDDFEMKLGDVMRGERATLGKSLLDVQRELRIKANYIAAIENCDTAAFETPGFIAGYVRSYARYLGMDSEETYQIFCAESGFTSTHNMPLDQTARSRQQRAAARPDPARKLERDPFTAPATPFIPERDRMFSRIEPAAIGSALVLLAVIGGLAYGGYAVFNEIQRVQFAPVENRPAVLADLDPLAGATRTMDDPVADQAAMAGGRAPAVDSVDRLYRPRALDVPVVVARDAPISTLNPARIGTFAAGGDVTTPASPRAISPSGDAPVQMASGEGVTDGATPSVPQVVTPPKPGVSLVAVRPAWVRVRSADGTILIEKILDAGETYDLPTTEEPPSLRAGMSGSVYFQVDGKYYGPAGTGTGVIRNVGLSPDGLKGNYALADLSLDPEAARVIALAESQVAEIEPGSQTRTD